MVKYQKHSHSQFLESVDEHGWSSQYQLHHSEGDINATLPVHKVRPGPWSLVIMSKIEWLLAFWIWKADGDRGEIREASRKITIENSSFNISSQKESWTTNRHREDVTGYLYCSSTKIRGKWRVHFIPVPSVIAVLGNWKSECSAANRFCELRLSGHVVQPAEIRV